MKKETQKNTPVSTPVSSALPMAMDDCFFFHSFSLDRNLFVFFLCVSVSSFYFFFAVIPLWFSLKNLRIIQDIAPIQSLSTAIIQAIIF